MELWSYHRLNLEHTNWSEINPENEIGAHLGKPWFVCAQDIWSFHSDWI